MSEPNCAHQWQVARNHAGRVMRVCRVCGQAELDPARPAASSPVQVRIRPLSIYVL